LLAPRETGLQFCRLQEDEFVARALLTTGVKPEQAKLMYYKLWALHIDSRALLDGPVTSSEPKLTESAPKKIRKSKIIKPGTFFRLDEQNIKDDVEIVMAMGTEANSKCGENDEVKYICAVVRSAVEVTGAYELFVANQRVIGGKRLNYEMKLEYDIHNRYYFIV
jgi:kinesin family protein 2/24